MGLTDDLRRLLLTGRPAIAMAPAPEPGAPSGGPATGAPTVTPLAGDGSPQLDSGIHLFQPRDVGDPKWTARYRRLLQLGSGTGLQDYPAMLLAAFLLNRFGPEDPYPDEQSFLGVLNVPTGGANFSRGILVNPFGSGVLAIVTQITGSAGAAAVNFNIGTETYVAGGAGLFAQPSVTLRATARDGRSPGYAAAGPGKCFIHTDGNIASQFQNGPVLNRIAPINTMVSFGSVDDPVVVLSPGTGVVLVPGAGATTLQGDVVWRERPVPAIAG